MGQTFKIGASAPKKDRWNTRPLWLLVIRLCSHYSSCADKKAIKHSKVGFFLVLRKLLLVLVLGAGIVQCLLNISCLIL